MVHYIKIGLKNGSPLGIPDFKQFSSLVAQRLNVCLQCRRPGFDPWVGKIPLEKEMATHSSILAWRIPWMEEPGGLQFTGSQGVGHDWATSLSLSLWGFLILSNSISINEGDKLVHSVQFSHSVMSESLRPHGLQHARLPHPSPTPRLDSNSCP